MDAFEKFSNYIKAQKFIEALSLTEQLLKNEPEKKADWIGLRAVAKFHLKDLSCIEDLNLTISLEPNNAFRYSSRAYILDALGDTSAAIEDYLKAVELDAEDDVAFNNLGLLQEKMGRKSKANDSFEASDRLLGLPKNAKRKFPEPSLQAQLNQEKSVSSRWKVIKDIFLSKQGWKEFQKFVVKKVLSVEKPKV